MSEKAIYDGVFEEAKKCLSNTPVRGYVIPKLCISNLGFFAKSMSEKKPTE